MLNKDIWHVRIDIPADVRAAIGQKTFRKSTGTGNLSEAKDISLPIIYEFKCRIAAARAAMQHDWERDAAENFLQRKQQRDYLFDIVGKASLADKFILQPEFFNNYKEGIQEQIKELVQEGNWELATKIKDKYIELVETLEDGHPTPDPDKVFGVYTALGRLQDDVLAYDIVNQNKLTGSEIPRLEEIRRHPSNYLDESPISAKSIEKYEGFLRTQIDKEKTIDEYLAKVRSFSDYLNTYHASISFDAVSAFIKLKSNKSKTQSKYLSALRSYWAWALKYHEPIRAHWASKLSPFDGHALPRNKEARKASYVPFTEEEQKLLFSEALKRKDPTLALAICYGIFSGCRLEEIGRIEATHTIFEKETPIAFSINEAKTEAGIRIVPLHRDLRPIHAHLTSETKLYLFKGGKNKYANRFDYISKRFGTLKNSLGFGRDKVFHSFRKSFITAMHRAGHGDGITPYIVGHEPESFTLSDYSGGPSLAQLSGAVEELSFNFIKDEIKQLTKKISLIEASD